jgi:exonuclease III
MATVAGHNLSICSYNSNGSGNGRIAYIKNLVQLYDFVLIQEHWLLTNQLDIYERHIHGCMSHSISGVDDTCLLYGRPYGGCSILWKHTVNCNVKPINSCSKRLCAVEIYVENLPILIINVYMPCDTMSNVSTYKETLQEIADLCTKSKAEHIVIGGDFNTEFGRTDSHVLPLLETLLLNEYICSVENKQGIDIDYTYESHCNGTKTKIDHIFVTENLEHNVVSYQVLHEGDNLSDHSPIIIELNLDMFYTNYNCENNFASYKLKWDEASKEDISKYMKKLHCLLDEIHIPWEAIQCNLNVCNIKCTEHKQQLSTYYNEIIQHSLNAADMCIPRYNTGKKTIIPGWNEFVKYYKEQAIFWHVLWKSNGSPRLGTIAGIRRKTRLEYHTAIKYVKNNEKRISANKLADAFFNNKTRDYCKEINKIKGSKSSKCTVNNVDGILGDSKICEHLATQYKDLYNSVSYDVNEMSNIIHKLDVLRECTDGDNRCRETFISVNEITKAVSYLKHGKTDGDFQHTSDHVLYGPKHLHMHLSLLFTGMLRHGFAPDGFLNSTIIPIPKNKRKSLNCSDNYRGERV